MSGSPARRPMKRLPPYSEKVLAARGVWISAGPRAWDRARRWQWIGDPGLVAPPDVDPMSFFWPVEGRNVRLIALDMARSDAARLIAALALHKPAVICCLHGPSAESELEIIVPSRDL